MAQVIARVEHGSAFGRWTLVRARPAAALAGLVAGYEGYREAAGAPVVRREIPIPRFPVILNFGDGFVLRPDRPGEGWRQERASFVAGLADHAFLVGSAGRASCLQFDLTPVGARRLLGIDLDAIEGQVVPLADLFGPGLARLLDALAAPQSWERRFARLDAFLMARLDAARAPDPAIVEAWRMLALSGGRARVGAVARRVGRSRQGLVTGFRREIGIEPKRAARILRLDRAAGLIAARPGLPLAEVALAAGFADQAHFAREVRAMAGVSPVALRAGMLDDGTGLMAGP